LVVEKLDPQGECIVNANNGLAWQEHVPILAEVPMSVKSSTGAGPLLQHDS
jgi:hypothetical protein